MKLTRTFLAAMGLASTFSVMPAHAVVVNGGAGTSVEGTGSSFVAELTYSSITPLAATLTIDLDNTTLPAVGGYLTAFVLNNPDDRITAVALTASPANFAALGLDSDGVNGAPFGQFDFGASTGGSFEGGGNPALGLAAGASGTFTFALVGTELDTLSAESFLSAFSVPPGAGEGTQFFAARYRGLTDGGSDKVAAVPEPSTYAVLLAGVGLLAWRLGRRLS